MDSDIHVRVHVQDEFALYLKSLYGSLPSRDDEMSQRAASMSANDGGGILFILDGWDELPSEYRQNSIFHQLIKPELSQKNPLHESAVIVTSRPIASGDLQRVVSSQVEILGFTLKNWRITEIQIKAVKTLLKRIQESPAVAGSCYLPLNASMLLYLKSDNNTLPTTQYGVFSELVLSCIFHHVNECTKHKNLSLETLDKLPEFISKPLMSLPTKV